jgi:Protein of unknown function (DUF3326)
MIQNKQVRINRANMAGATELPEAISQAVGKNALRWYVAEASKESLLIEYTVCDGLGSFDEPGQSRIYPGKSALLNIIPTGVGCSLGGYAGDAAPVTNLLASTVDYLICNPNSVNASDFINLEASNLLYTDGCSIDLFCKGLVDLHLPYANRIGLIIEKADDHSLEAVLNVVNAVRAVHGVDIIDFVITDGSIGGRCIENSSGAFVGTVDNPAMLFEACSKLIKRGANALAITSNIQDLPLGNYARHFDGEYPNPIGGVEAVISYMVTSKFRVPCAHAPLMNLKQLDLRHNIVDARAAGEFASWSGLACILIGLRKAARIANESIGRCVDALSLNNLLAVVTPASCLGGVPVLYAWKNDIPVIAVKENTTVLNITKQTMGVSNLIEVETYLEAAGAVMALKKGISLESLTRPLQSFRY